MAAFVLSASSAWYSGATARTRDDAAGVLTFLGAGERVGRGVFRWAPGYASPISYRVGTLTV
jgi:hypothetical protein